MTTERENLVTSLITLRACIVNQDQKILLIKRSNKNKTNIGKWEFPGGKLEKGELLNEVLKREIDQETGIILYEISNTLCHVTSRLISEIPDYAGITHVTITTPIQINGKPKIKLSHEHDAFAWMSKTEALTMDLRDEVREALLANII
ncbi:NUDIX domain-containing protein [soil metagenome]